MLTVLLSLNESVSSSVGKCSNRLGTRALAKGSGVVQRDSRCVSHRWNLRPHFRHTGSGHRILISQIPTDSYRYSYRYFYNRCIANSSNTNVKDWRRVQLFGKFTSHTSRDLPELLLERRFFDLNIAWETLDYTYAHLSLSVVCAINSIEVSILKTLESVSSYGVSHEIGMRRVSPTGVSSVIESQRSVGGSNSE